jgi:hypothetical protein
LRLAGAVAQLGERLVRNEEVSGSIPLGSTNSKPLSKKKNFACQSVFPPWVLGRHAVRLFMLVQAARGTPR